jgi:hypothetical protein
VDVIDVVVDELVLDGVAPDDPLVAAAIERAVADQGLPAQAAAVAGAVVREVAE